MSASPKPANAFERLSERMEGFPLGRTPLVMLVLFVIAALAMGFESEPEGQRLTYWVFARTHYDDYQTAKVRFEADHPGWTVDIKLVDSPSLLTLPARWPISSRPEHDSSPDTCSLWTVGCERARRAAGGRRRSHRCR